MVYEFFKKSPTLSLSIYAVFFFALGVGFFALFTTYSSKATASTITTTDHPPTRLVESDYPLIKPLLLCNVQTNNDSVDTSLQKQVTQFVKDRVSKGAVDDMSIYIQEYGAGKWVGVNQDEQYDPASLLKVPLMIAYYQLAEKTPGILSQTIAFNGTDQNIGEYYKSPNNIVSGVSYSVDNLIKSMIVNSDNTALILLTNYIDITSLLQVYSDLGLPVPKNNSDVQYISAESYAYFFRILYNATYIDREYSEKALDLLTQTKFMLGIRAGVPSTVTVADKFGERSFSNGTSTLPEHELHDCGIIYKTGSPYLLCVMSRGKDFDQLANNIRDLSALVYQDLVK